MDVGQNQPEQLKRAMPSRHLFMISLGGVIGTGFSTSGCVDLVSHIWAVFVLIKCQVSESVRGVGVFLFNH